MQQENVDILQASIVIFGEPKLVMFSENGKTTYR